MASGKAQFFNAAAQGKNHLVVFECVNSNHWVVKRYVVKDGVVVREPSEIYDPSGSGSACGIRACVKACEWASISTPEWDISDDRAYRQLRTQADNILLQDADREPGFGARARQLFATQSVGRPQRASERSRSPQSSRNDDQKQSILRQLSNRGPVDQKEFTTRKMLIGSSFAKLFTIQISLQSQIYNMLCCRTITACLGTGQSVLERYVNKFEPGLFSKPTLPGIECFTKSVIGSALRNAFKTDNDYKLRFQQSSKKQRDDFRLACFNVISDILSNLMVDGGFDSYLDHYDIRKGVLRKEFLEVMKEEFEQKADEIFGASALLHEALDEKRCLVPT